MKCLLNHPDPLCKRCLTLCGTGDCECAGEPGGQITQPVAAPTHGPGTELKKLLAKVGITATPDCPCNDRAAEMDRQGCEWCEANIETIVGWLREQAEARGLPFLDVAGRMLVRLAIKKARARPDFNDPPPGPQSTS